MLDQISSSPIGLGLLGVGALAALYLLHILLDVPLPKGVDRIREPPGKTSFSWKTRLAYVTDCQQLFHEAYHEYSKKGKAVIIPGVGARSELILPVSSMRWALRQPEHVLNVGEAFAEVDQIKHSLGHTRFVIDSWPGLLIRTELNSALENIVAAMNDELKVAFDAHFGTDDKEWKEVPLLETIRVIVAQAASRFTVGLPLCRNPKYLKDAIAANESLVLTAGLVGAAPPILRPVIGPLVGLKTELIQRRIKKIFESTYRARLETLKYAKDDPEHKEPGDHLQMMVRFAQRERPQYLYDLDIMARYLTTTNFGAMHQTGIQVTNMLLNILGSDAEYNTIAVLRDEATRIMGSEDGNGRWTKAKLSKMVQADSVARETLRCHSFGGRAVFRKVMVDGLETDTGLKLPQGCLFSFLSQPAHTDEATYEDPDQYDPFRFSRLREKASNGGDPSEIGTLSFVTTSPDHLPFGHGKHACPGRFLIDFELKMIISYVLSNYDVKFPEEYNHQRPPNKWLTEAILPPDGVKVLVRRRHP
ncbi:hypothetical protein ASPZODRAFT_66197 [Penicilliopsis zonata CBS 506.65]|uniref:Cytochrome P450 n=1 Tax=Penicilliopsis zonata CBS 506.65 TaxID=1073090 RepID=A0A1L9SH74_9EURO|nr:hypothetical protein ASPZODRAFT_66197 [Penicilliopsis zonata CBS 506.65]OJJ46552.1 hypothetical protein ASPZODRAFT_66197 [Penicilliopsis zonata CBS 506.65]